MKLNRILTITAMALCSTLYAQQQAQNLSIEKCREMAIENNKNIRIAREQLKKSGYDKSSARSLYLPNFSAYGGYLYTTNNLDYTLKGGYLPTYNLGSEGTLQPNVATSNGAPIIGADGNPVFNQYAYMPDIKLKMDPSGFYSAGLKVEQPIYMGGKIYAANKMASLGKTMNELNVRYTESEVIVASDDAYWKYVQVKEMVKAAQAYLDLLKELHKRVKDGQETGMIRRTDLLKVEVKLNEAELQLSKAQNGLSLAAMNLCHTIGLPLTTPISTSDEIDSEILSLENVADTSFQSRPEYQIIEYEVELKKREMEIERADYLPQIGAALSYGYSNGLKVNGDKQIDGTSLSAMVTVNVPLFQWGKGYNKVRSKKTEQVIAQLKQEKTAELMQLEVASARNDVMDAALRVEMTKKSLTQAQENLKESKDMYDVGMETLSDHLEAQAQWQKATSDLIEAKTQYNLYQTKYLKATGRLNK